MCGIAGMYLKSSGPKRPSRDLLIALAEELVLNIEERGHHATGFVAMSKKTKTADAKVVMRKRPVAAKQFVKDGLLTFNMYPKAVLLHTRYTTQGHQSVNANNHPMIWRSCFVTHNGVLQNDDELFKQLSIERQCATDSAILPVLLDGKFDTAAEALSQVRGNYAIACIDPLLAPNRLLLAKNRFNPLVVYQNENILVWASTHRAIEKAWFEVFKSMPKRDNFYTLEDREVWVVNDDDVITKSMLPFEGGQTTRPTGRGRGAGVPTTTPGSNPTVDVKDLGTVSVTELMTHDGNDGRVINWMFAPNKRGAFLWASIQNKGKRGKPGEAIGQILAQFLWDEHRCPCGTDEDMFFTIGDDTMCIDCYNAHRDCPHEIGTNHYKKLRTGVTLGLLEAAGETTCEIQRETNPLIDDDTLVTAADEVGIDPVYAEWLLTHAEPEKLSKVAKAHLDEIDEAYTNNDITENWGL